MAHRNSEGCRIVCSRRQRTSASAPMHEASLSRTIGWYSMNSSWLSIAADMSSTVTRSISREISRLSRPRSLLNGNARLLQHCGSTHQLRYGSCAQLRHHARAQRLHCAFASTEVGRHLLVEPMRDHTSEDRSLGARKRGETRRQLAQLGTRGDSLRIDLQRALDDREHA